MSDEKDLDRDETERKEPTVLSEREAMSIISQGSPSGEENVPSEDRRKRSERHAS